MIKKQYLLATLFQLLVIFPGLVLGGTEPGTGLEGVIVLSPATAGPTKVGVPDSIPLANVELSAKRGDETVTTFKTDDQGRFRVSLTPGRYTISLKDGKRRIGRYGPFEVDVVAGQITRVQWACDSGMR